MMRKRVYQPTRLNSTASGFKESQFNFPVRSLSAKIPQGSEFTCAWMAAWTQLVAPEQHSACHYIELTLKRLDCRLVLLIQQAFPSPPATLSISLPPTLSSSTANSLPV